MKFYRSVPLVVQVVKWKGDNAVECFTFCNKLFIRDKVLNFSNNGKCTRHEINSYIVKYPKGDFKIFTEEEFINLFEEI